MIRFCDLREAYWLFPDGHYGPFAFIDTVTDTFVTLAGVQLFDDPEHFEEVSAFRSDASGRALVLRCRGHMLGWCVREGIPVP